MQRLSFLFPFTVLVIFFTSFGSFTELAAQGKKDKKRKKGEQSKILSESELLEFKSTYADAGKERMMGNLKKAVDLYSKCLQINPSTAATRYELANIYIIQRDFDAAMEMAKQAVELNNRNIWYQLLLAELYRKKKDVDGAIGIFENLVDEHPDRRDLFEKLATAYAAKGEAKKAVDIYNRLENQYGVSEEIILAKNHIHYQNGDKGKIETELKKLVNTYPDRAKYQGMLGDYYMSMQQFEDAYEAYQKLREIDPYNEKVFLQLAHYYKRTGKKDEALEALKKAFASNSIDLPTKIPILVAGVVTAQDKSDSSIFELLNILEKTHPQEPSVYTLYSNYHEKRNNPQGARDKLAQALELSKDKYELWDRLILLDMELMDFSAVYDHSKEAMGYFPNQPRPLLYNGVAAAQKQRFKEALKSLRIGLNLVIEDDELMADFYYHLAEVSHKNKDYEKSDEYFAELFALKPNHEIALNNYSYYLTLRNEQLEKAREMIQKVLERKPNDSTYLDTYAWVLYKLGEYEEAKLHAEKSMANGGSTSAVIQEHYGDILYKLGQTDQALVQWKKAKELGKGSDQLDEKIKQGKLVE